jgi:Tol biopolymer transport system component
MIGISDWKINFLDQLTLVATHTSDPSYSFDGSKLLFISRIDQVDHLNGGYSYDVFVRVSEGNRRLTHLRSYITDSSISGDGARAVFVTEDRFLGRPGGTSRLWMVNTNGSALTEIALPDPD